MTENNVNLNNSNYAFREWNKVCYAIKNGKQSILIRKGGIHEGKKGFKWSHDKFFLLRSYYHFENKLLKDSYIEKNLETSNNLHLEVYCEIVLKKFVSNKEIINKLFSYHVYNQNLIDERFNYNDVKGLNIAVIKTYKLKNPINVGKTEDYKGCKSWFLINNKYLQNNLKMHAILDEDDFTNLFNNLKIILEK